MNEIDRFKGERHYVHATDELLAVEPLLSSARRFTFTARKVGTCVAHWREIESRAADKAEHMETIARLITEGLDGSRRIYECQQDTSRPITAQVPFDEDALARYASIEVGTLTCRISTDYTLWEYLSTLQKILLQRHIGYPQWFLVRLELETPSCWPPTSCLKSLTLHYRQQKGMLYLSDVLFDGRVVGEIGYAKR